MRDGLCRILAWAEAKGFNGIRDEFSFLEEFDRELGEIAGRAIVEARAVLASYLPVCDERLSKAAGHHKSRSIEATRRRIEREIMRLGFLVESNEEEEVGG